MVKNRETIGEAKKKKGMRRYDLPYKGKIKWKKMENYTLPA